ncbi:MAG: hypothetical protein IJ815_06425 [Lachnospiraceae bacterium]|nr:hypothetical protein [Lachnospiraceae bacterium]
MNNKAGTILSVISTVVCVIAAIIYPLSAFSGDYGPFPIVEVLLIIAAILGITTILFAIKKPKAWLNFCEILLCFISMLSLMLGMYTMMTPVGYVVSGLNSFSEISLWAYSMIAMASAVVFHIVSLFFPIVENVKE